MERKLIITSDGSHSLYIPELNEHYHSIHGAIQESKHVFIEAGLKHFLSKNNSAVNILEIGFGTGLNALLTQVESRQKKIHIHYTSVEAFPVSDELVAELNYPAQLTEDAGELPALQIIFNTLHSCAWEKENEITPSFNFKKIKNTLQQTVFNDAEFHLIYFDAFGPPVQPEMWTEEIFTKLFRAMKPGGCLVTYCAKGEVKRTLKRVGFIVESLPGPPFKREMVRAEKPIL